MGWSSDPLKAGKETGESFFCSQVNLLQYHIPSPSLCLRQGLGCGRRAGMHEGGDMSLHIWDVSFHRTTGQNTGRKELSIEYHCSIARECIRGICIRFEHCYCLFATQGIDQGLSQAAALWSILSLGTNYDCNSGYLVFRKVVSWSFILSCSGIMWSQMSDDPHLRGK